MNAAPLPVLLLVEDEPLLLLNVEETLNEAGFEALTASDGYAAMKEIEEDCTRFSAVVTDVDLRNSPSGWEAARRARQLKPSIPVIYMSGASHNEWAAEGVPKSVMLVKPFAPAQLVTAVATLITETSMLDDQA